jgi:hypothetical protein
MRSPAFRALAFVSWVPAATACSSGGGGVHGPVFGVDSGSDTATDYPPDGAIVDVRARDQLARDAATDAHTEDGRAADAQSSDGGIDGASDVSSYDAPTGDGGSCPSGHGTIALVGGTTSLAFGATSKNGAAWVTSSFPTASVGAAPGLIALSGGFLTVFPAATTDEFQSSVFTSTWSTPASIFAVGDSGGPALGVGAPALVAAGSSAHLVYLGSNDKFYHDTFTASAWGAANDPVGGAAEQGFGDTPPTAAFVGTTLYAAYNGSNSMLYVDPWTGGTWGAAAAVSGASVSMGVAPTLVGLASGDLLIVYETSGNALYSAAYSGGTWSTPVAVDGTTASTNSPVSMAPLPAGGAVMVYLGATDSFPYFSIYSPMPAPTWTAPAKVYANSLPLESAPTVAAGTCGVDAVAALTLTVGVEIVTLTGTTWSSPVVVGGTGSMTYASIATLP